MKYKAYLIEQKDDQFSGSIKELDAPSIESGHLLISVHYSSLNYKDEHKKRSACLILKRLRGG